MSRVADTIARRKQEAAGALIGYLPAGFPDLATSIDAAVALAENGVDVIELGLPYSDPVMDGTVTRIVYVVCCPAVTVTAGVTVEVPSGLQVATPAQVNPDHGVMARSA